MTDFGATTEAAAMRRSQILPFAICAALILAVTQCTGCYISNYAEAAPLGHTVQIWSAPEQVLVARDGSVAVKFYDYRICRTRYIVATPEVFQGDLLSRAWRRENNTFLNLAPGSVSPSSWALVPLAKRAPNAVEGDLPWKPDFIVARYGSADRVSYAGLGEYISFEYECGEVRKLCLGTECITHRKASTLVLAGAGVADVVTCPIQALYCFGRFCCKAVSGTLYD
jgi:hypothetical protein